MALDTADKPPQYCRSSYITISNGTPTGATGGNCSSSPNIVTEGGNPDYLGCDEIGGNTNLCSESDSYTTDDYVHWACQCGNRTYRCSDRVLPTTCSNSGNGCAVAGGQRCQSTLALPKGPSTNWWCENNEGLSNSCSAASYPSANPGCCYTGYRCDGNTIKYYRQCKESSQIGYPKTCAHGCVDYIGWSGNRDYSAACNDCTTDSHCSSVCSAGFGGVCSDDTIGSSNTSYKDCLCHQCGSNSDCTAEPNGVCHVLERGQKKCKYHDV